MNNNIYEIPLTDPAAPPFGAPGASGALPPQHGVLPPDAVPSVDFSQLPPPGMDAPPSSAAPAPAAPAPEAFGSSAPPVFEQPLAAPAGMTPPPAVDLHVPS
ncbi:MAG: hypothetical protein QM598_02800, partial [Protaetiibacter sp.]